MARFWRTPPSLGPARGQAQGHQPQNPSPAEGPSGQDGERQRAQGQQRTMAVREHPHQQIRAGQGEQNIRPAAQGIGRSDPARGQAPVGGPAGQSMEDLHVAPAEIQPLAPHRVAVVGALPHQNGAAPMQSAGQSQSCLLYTSPSPRD